MKQTDLVKRGYDLMAVDYLADRERLKSGKYVQKLLKYLPKDSTILDLGCGAGVPVDDVLLKAGHSVVGVDISPMQIKLARKNCPKGQYLVGDIATLAETEYQVQGVVVLYALFHLPRTDHPRILRVIASNMVRGGVLLITMGDHPFEGEHRLYGQTMWSSQWGTARNREMVESAGFRTIVDEMDTSGGERHQVIVAEKV
jgi:trans-aconitate methyltransferase